MERRLAEHLDDGTSVKLHKLHATGIAVAAFGEAEYRHDFGNTYL